MCIRSKSARGFVLAAAVVAVIAPRARGGYGSEFTFELASGALGTGIAGTQQVGNRYSYPGPGSVHGFLWFGNSDSYIDLTPSGGFVTGISGNRQIGSAGAGQSHATLWSGTPDNYVDLNPGLAAGFSNTY